MNGIKNTMSSDGASSEHSRSPSPGGEVHILRNIIADPEIEAAWILFGMKKRGARPQEERLQPLPSQKAPAQQPRPVSDEWMIKVSLVGSGTRNGKDWYCQLWQGSRIEGCIWIMGDKKEPVYRFKKSGNDKFFAVPSLNDNASDADLKQAFSRAAGKDARFLNSSSLRLKRTQIELQQVKLVEECWAAGGEVPGVPPRLHLERWMLRLIQAIDFRNEGANLLTQQNEFPNVEGPQGACFGAISEQEGSFVCDAHKDRIINRDPVTPTPKESPKRKRNEKKAAPTPAPALNETKQIGNDENVFSAPEQAHDMPPPASKRLKPSNKKASSPRTSPQSNLQQNINDKEMISAQAPPITQQLTSPLTTHSTISPDHVVRLVRQKRSGGHDDRSTSEADHEKKPIAPAQTPEVRYPGTPSAAAPEQAQAPTANVPASAPAERAAPMMTKPFDWAEGNMSAVTAQMQAINERDTSWMIPPKPKPKKTKARGTKTTKKH